VLCIWWEDWPLRRPDASLDRPCVVATREVVAANQLAKEAGIVIGMQRRAAEAMCPGGLVLDQDVGAELARFEPAVQIVESLVPKVEVAASGLLYVEISGALQYYGGEENLVELIGKELDIIGGSLPRLGVANGPFAARRAAAVVGPGEVYAVLDDARFLADVDVEALSNRDLVATFRWLGITTLGALSALPRPTVVSRFGDVGLEAHRLASGEDRTARIRPLPVDVSVEDRYEEPIELLERAGFAARSAASKLVVALREQGSATHRLEVEAEAADGTVRTRVWRSADPFTEEMLAERVWWQMRAWIENGGVAGGLVRLRLSPADISGEGRQLGFLEDTVATIEAERALARVQAIVGHDRVLGARPRGGRDPGERVSWHRWGEPPESEEPQAPWPGALPSPSPALIPPDRQHLEIEWDGGQPVRVRLRSRWEPVLNWAGPWRRSGRWWTGQETVDRYQLVTSAGALLCEVQEGRAYLVGVYD